MSQVLENMLLIQSLEEKFEGTKEAIVIRKSRRTDNTLAKRKRQNNDSQNIIQKIKYRATRTPLKCGVNSGAPEGEAVPFPHVARYSCYKSGTLTVWYCFDFHFID